MSKVSVIRSRWIALLLGVVVCLSASAQTELKKMAPKRTALKELQVDTTKQLLKEDVKQIGRAHV